MWIYGTYHIHTPGGSLSHCGTLRLVLRISPEVGHHPHPDHGIHWNADDQQDAAEAGRPGPTCQGGLDDTPPVGIFQWASSFFAAGFLIAVSNDPAQVP
jgi:hypothetical protein